MYDNKIWIKKALMTNVLYFFESKLCYFIGLYTSNHLKSLYNSQEEIVLYAFTNIKIFVK